MKCRACAAELAPAGNCEQCPPASAEATRRIKTLTYDRRTGMSTFTYTDGTKEVRRHML